MQPDNGIATASARAGATPRQPTPYGLALFVAFLAGVWSLSIGAAFLWWPDHQGPAIAFHAGIAMIVTAAALAYARQAWTISTEATA
jgi:hypothetical protein